MINRLISLVIVAVVCQATAVLAQESASAGIAGQVFDSSHAAVPGATVTVINAELAEPEETRGVRL